MRQRLILSTFSLLFATTLAAASAIYSISPITGPVSGGTKVTIRLTEPLSACPILPPLPTVTFGGVPAAFEFLDETTIEAVTPPHAAGTVDVQLHFCGNPDLVSEHIFTYLDVEPVLLPVFFFGPGALGSEWVTTAVAHNSGSTPIAFANAPFQGNCPAGCGCAPSQELAPGESGEVCSALAYPGGLLLFPTAGRGDDLHVNLRVRDVSRSSEGAGTEVPVVRKSDLRSKVVLLNIPAEALFRTTLRIYDVEGRDGVQVRMQIFHPSSETPLVDRVVTLSQPVRTLVPEPFPPYPAYAYIADPFGEIATDEARTGPYRIDLTPVAPLERFWAMASITNNVTQQVTLVTP